MQIYQEWERHPKKLKVTSPQIKLLNVFMKHVLKYIRNENRLLQYAQRGK